MASAQAASMAGLGAARPPKVGKAGTAMVVGLAALLALMAGLLLSLGSTQVAILVVAAIVGPVVLFLPATALLYAFLAASFVVAGMLQYFAKVNQAHWLPSLVLLAMLLRAPLDAFGQQLSSEKPNPGGMLLKVTLFVFVAAVLASGAANASAPLQFLVGLKHYIFPLALVALVSQARLPQAAWQRVWGCVPWLMLLQMPVALYQFFFVALRRNSALTDLGIAWDAVVGTFGGDPDRGGASGALALFLAFGVAVVVSQRRAGQVSARLMWAALLAATVTTVLAEIKVMIVYVPIAVMVAQRHRILRSPVAAVGWAGGMLLFVVALFAAYNTLFWNEARGGKQRNLAQAFEYAFVVEGSAGFYNSLTGEVSRVGALVRWWEHNPGSGDAMSTTLGYGPAASKISGTFGMGDAAKKFRYNLTTSSLSAMLWDLGLLGVLVYSVALALGFARAVAAGTAQWRRGDGRAVGSDAAAVALALVAASLPYNMDALNSAAIQALAALAWGYALVAGGHSLGSQPARA